MNEVLDQKYRELADRIKQVCRQQYSPPPSVVAQLWNALGQADPERMAFTLKNDSAGSGTSGTLLVWVEGLVAVVSLTDAPSEGDDSQVQGALDVLLLRRSSILDVRVHSGVSAQHGVSAHLSRSTVLQLRYRGLPDPLAVGAFETEDLDALVALVLDDLRQPR